MTFGRGEHSTALAAMVNSGLWGQAVISHRGGNLSNGYVVAITYNNIWHYADDPVFDIRFFNVSAISLADLIRLSCETSVSEVPAI